MKLIITMPNQIICFLFLVTLFWTSCSTNDKQGNVNDFTNSFAPKAESFSINPANDTLIKCKNGTTIYLLANSIQLPEGTATDRPIQIEIQECYSLMDIIGSNLSTRSGDRILETAGMVNISVSCDGQPLSLKEGQQYAIGFPKKDQAKPMELFYGNMDSLGKINWTQASLSKQEPVTNLDESNLIDQSRSTCKLNISGYTSGVGKKAVTWKMKNSDKTIFTYFLDNFKASKEMRNDFCSKNYNLELSVKINSAGKISGILIDSPSTPRYDKLITDFLYSMPHLDTNSIALSEMGNDNFDYFLAFTGSDIIDSDKYNGMFNKKYATFKDRAISKIDKDELNFYIQTSSKFGWINCDRFWDTTDEKIEYSVKTEYSNNTKIIIVFKGIKSVMQGFPKDDAVVFSNIPVNQAIRIIGIRYTNGKPTMGIAETTTDKNGFELKDFKEFTLAQLESELNKVN